MGCLGVHFALDGDDAARVLGCAGDDGVLAGVIEEIEEHGDADWGASTDKAWDAIHRCFNGGEIAFRPDDPTKADPLHLCILGGVQVYQGDEYIAVYKSAGQVRAIAEAVATISEQEFRRRYDLISAASYHMKDEPLDFGYTWENFRGLVPFYIRAAEAGRAVLFTADQ